MKLRMFGQSLLTLIFIFGLGGCQNAEQKNAPSPDRNLSEAQKLERLLDDYFAEFLERNPVYATFVGVNDYNHRFSTPISADSQADSLAFEKRYLRSISAINADELAGQDLLSYQIFKRDRELAIREFEFPGQFVSISQMGGAHSYFALLGSGASAQPFSNEKDYRDFLQRAQGFVLYMDSIIDTMREGIKAEVLLPKPVVLKLIPQLETHLVADVEQSVFYAPIAQLADNSSISAETKAALRDDYRVTISQRIIPAYERLAKFLEDEYLPQARDSVGLAALPKGKAWYDFRIEEQTTLPLSAEDIHEFGKSEVARILAEMTKVKTQVGFKGSLGEFFNYLRDDEQFYFNSEEEVIAAYEDVKAKINARVPQLFEVFPKADYEVRAVEAFRAASAAGASYQSPAPDGSRPGIFYINTHNLKAQPKFLVETLSIHEAAPGHHFQISIQQEVEDLPQFRRFGGYTVFAEGWALYAESLGKEMGLFTDPYMWYGRLADEQLRAMRLVVDTGLHAFGWTRQQAIDYMLANSSMAESDVVAEVERYIVIPAQALAYKTGERHIRMLRNKAKKVLGDQFDIRKFHTQILIDGALPMPILETKINRWIDSQTAQQNS